MPASGGNANSDKTNRTRHSLKPGAYSPGLLSFRACVLSFPHYGNVLLKLLDSSFRWNDDGDKWVFCHSDNPSAIPAELLTSALTVIPAQAGIQWFNHDSRYAGMTTKTPT